MGLTEILVTAALVVGVVIGGVGRRVVVTLDWNNYRKRRREERKEQLRALCPHAMLYTDGEIGSWFVSPAGTMAWRCERCGLAVASKTTVDQLMNSWIKDPKGLLKREQKIEKLARKLYGA